METKNFLVLFLSLTFLFPGCLEEEKKVIGVMVAVESEFRPFMDLWNFGSSRAIENLTFYFDDKNDREVVVVRTGPGKVNAAIATTMLINEFDVDYIIFAGTSGGLNETLSIGDIVISRDLFQYDYGMRTDEGFEHWDIEISNETSCFYLEADEGLREISLTASVNFNRVDGRIINRVEGRIATADEFATGEEFFGWISRFDANCVEMEGAAVAQVCYKLGKPFLVVRTVSDTPREEDSFETFQRYAYEVSQNTALLVDAIVQKL